jgi:site-specific recombinase XerD
MLTIYRRHRKECEHRSEGRKYRRCRCPIWVDGFLAGREIRKSLNTADWQRAQDVVREMEATESEPKDTNEPITIQQTWEKFLADAAARKLSEPSIYKYELLSRQMQSFAERDGYRFLSELTVDVLSTFRTGWKDGALSGSKKLERLRTFMGFALRRKWITDNPARELKAPKVQLRPTLPFTHKEMVSILTAIEAYAARTAHNGRINARRMRSLVLLLRYSGMRIGDAVSLTADRISGNRLFLYTAKTDTPVYTVLPDFVVRALEATPKMTERYYFWTSAGKLSTAVRMWDTRLKRVFDKAGIVKGHAHRLRDTFAVALLLEGVPMERVSILLGHTSIIVTEKHYAPWVRERQEQLEADVSRVWSNDPLALLEAQSQTKGTPRVHRINRTVN